MIILAFETTGSKASVAIIDGAGSVTEKRSAGVLNHLQSLIPMTEELFGESGITAKDITCVAVSAGPGSFTGVRIGVATARAFAQAMDIPCVAVPTLQSFLYNMENYRGWACPVLDARRGEVYSGAFSLDEEGVIHEHIPGSACVLSGYLEALREKAEEAGAGDITFFEDGMQRASSVARLGSKLYREGKAVSYKELTPQYMRKAEAERKLEAGHLFIKR